MTLIYSAENLPTLDGKPETRIGGKGLALLTLYKAGLPVPKPICISTCGYNLFVEENRLRERINLELHRKELKEMRWEEISRQRISLILPVPFNKQVMPG